MRIGELAVRSGLTAKTLRFYEQAGVLPEPARRDSGYRDYDPAALDRLAFVKAAQAAGLTLAQVREILEVREREGPPCDHVAGMLDARAADLDRRIDDLVSLRDEVRRLRRRATALDPSDCGPASVCDVLAPLA